MPASGWFTVGQENKFRAGAEIRNISGTGTAINIGIETATDTRNPDSGKTDLWTSDATSDGVVDPDSSSVTPSGLMGKLFYRYVWVIKVTSGTGWADVSGFVDAFDQG